MILLGLAKILLIKKYTTASVLISFGVALVLASMFYSQVGRPVFLSLHILLNPIKKLISIFLTIVMYCLGILFPGIICKICRIKKIKKDWKELKRSKTTFNTAEPFEQQNFTSLS
jgi:predicted membrane protein